MAKSTHWTDRAVESWVKRRTATVRRRKKASEPGDWADRAIDSWIQRRAGKLKRSPKTSKRSSCRGFQKQRAAALKL